MFPIARDGLWTFIAAQCHSLEIADPVGRFHRHRNSFVSDGGGSTTCRSSGPGNICNGTISGSGIRSMFQIHQNYMRKEYCNLRGIRFPVEFFRAACWWEVSKRRTFSHARFRPSFSWSLKGERTVAHLIFPTYEFCIKLPERTWKVASFATNKESADSAWADMINLFGITYCRDTVWTEDEDGDGRWNDLTGGLLQIIANDCHMSAWNSAFVILVWQSVTWNFDRNQGVVKANNLR